MEQNSKNYEKSDIPASKKVGFKIYTSYFGNIHNLGKAGIVTISVARYSPRWFKGARFEQLAPFGWMLSKDVTEEKYIQAYKSLLSQINVNAVVEQLIHVANGRDVALLCYEKPGDFCHRHLLAEWLTEQTGIEVSEFVVSYEAPKPKVVQLSLLF